ncbi:FHA domain-containing protein, partial [Frisingicoccus sp.]|uniref:FHA domain-containing protein n=1 Tax=Frisingicoccus sp. TaxID=1918627 RepID=UPI002A82C156
MSTILTVYSSTAFKRFLLPAINNANYSILLSSSLFNLEENIELKLEIIDNAWYYSQSCDYELRKQDQASCFGKKLHDGDIVKLFVCGKAVLSFIVKETDQYFSVYRKYDIQDVHNSITIGSDEDNVIVCNESYLIAARHAKIHIENQGAYFEDLGGLNGSFVNNRRVIGSIPLSYGDCIDIYG